MTGFAGKTPGFNNKIPKSILTPDHVKTPIWDLNFFDGMPDKATVQKVYDNLIFMRGDASASPRMIRPLNKKRKV